MWPASLPTSACKSTSIAFSVAWRKAPDTHVHRNHGGSVAQTAEKLAHRSCSCPQQRQKRNRDFCSCTRPGALSKLGTAKPHASEQCRWMPLALHEPLAQGYSETSAMCQRGSLSNLCSPRNATHTATEMPQRKSGKRLHSFNV